MVWKVPLLAGAVSLAVAGGALAAVGLLHVGAPVPNPPGGHTVKLAAMDPGSRALLSLRAADPAGGLPWGIEVARRGDGRMFCAQVGRVHHDVLGIIGRDGAFNNDGRFHPLSPSADQSEVCGGTTPGGQLFAASSGPPIPASAYTGSFSSAVGGCRENIPDESMSAHTRRALAHVPVCARNSLRIVKFGFAGREAKQVEYSNRLVRVRQTPDPETSGAYLFVLTPAAAGREPLVLTVTYRDGTVCRDDQTRPPACFPPPGG